MDILLTNGDHGVDSRGLPRQIAGEELLVQQALIYLSVPKGSFPYDPTLGSELFRLQPDTEENLSRAALSYAQEALAPLAGIQATNAKAYWQTPEVLSLTFTLTLEGSPAKQTTVEVTQSR